MNTTINHKYIQVEEGVYHYVESGSNKDTLLLFLHGFPESWYSWKYQLEYFTKLDYHCIVLDMPGYGESKVKNELDNFTTKKIAKNIYDKFILTNKNKNKNIFVIGHDWGAAVLWDIAYFYGNSIQGAIGLSVPYLPPLRKFKSIKEKAQKNSCFNYQVVLANGDDKELDNNLDIFVKFFWNLSTTATDQLVFPLNKTALQHFKDTMNEHDIFPDQQYLDFLISQFKIQGTTGAINWYRAADLNVKNDLLKQHGNIECKSLTILGEKDFLTQFGEVGKRFLKDGKYKYIKEAGHWIQYTHPKQVNESILEFINNNSKLSHL